MARKKSYFTAAGKKDPCGVFLNNMVAASQQRARERKVQERQEASAARAAESNRKRQEREAEQIRRKEEKRHKQEVKEQQKIEKQLAAEEKKNAKINDKKEKLRARLEIELTNAKIPYNDTNIREIVTLAYEADITAGKLKTTLVDPNIKKYSRRGLYEIFVSCVPVDVSLENDLESLMDEFCAELPVDLEKIQNSNEWRDFIEVCEGKNAALERDRTRVSVFEEIQLSKSMFSEDLEELWGKSVDEDWSGEEMKNSQMYSEFTESKESYMEEIENRIKKFMEP